MDMSNAERIHFITHNYMGFSDVFNYYEFADMLDFVSHDQYPGFRFGEELMRYYKALYEKNIPVDFVSEKGDFSRYRLLIAPLQYLMSSELEDRFFDIVKNGGHLILTMRTGVKDMTNICMTDRELPGRLSELAGIEVIDYDCLRDGGIRVAYDGSKFEAGLWADIIRKTSENVRVFGSFDEDFYAGEPCITQNKYGDGCCYYVGTSP